MESSSFPLSVLGRGELFPIHREKEGMFPTAGSYLWAGIPHVISQIKSSGAVFISALDFPSAEMSATGGVFTTASLGMSQPRQTDRLSSFLPLCR